MPLIFLGTFTSAYHHEIGLYGLYKNIDGVLETMIDKKGQTQVGRLTKEFLDSLKQNQN